MLLWISCLAPWGIHNQLLLCIWKLLELCVLVSQLFLGCVQIDYEGVQGSGSAISFLTFSMHATASIVFLPPLSLTAGSSEASCLKSFVPSGVLLHGDSVWFSMFGVSKSIDIEFGESWEVLLHWEATAGKEMSRIELLPATISQSDLRSLQPTVSLDRLVPIRRNPHQFHQSDTNGINVH